MVDIKTTGDELSCGKKGRKEWATLNCPIPASKILFGKDVLRRSQCNNVLSATRTTNTKYVRLTNSRFDALS